MWFLINLNKLSDWTGSLEWIGLSNVTYEWEEDLWWTDSLEWIKLRYMEEREKAAQDKQIIKNSSATYKRKACLGKPLIIPSAPG